jgi:hypothetical protein
VGFGPHRQLLEAIERSIQRDIARNGEVLQGGSKALKGDNIATSLVASGTWLKNLAENRGVYGV